MIVATENLKLVEQDAGESDGSGKAVENELVGDGAGSQEEATLAASTHAHDDLARP